MPELTESFKPDRIVLLLQIEKKLIKSADKTLNKKELIIEFLTLNPSAKTTVISKLNKGLSFDNTL